MNNMTFKHVKSRATLVLQKLMYQTAWLTEVRLSSIAFQQPVRVAVTLPAKTGLRR